MRLNGLPFLFVCLILGLGLTLAGCDEQSSTRPPAKPAKPKKAAVPRPADKKQAETVEQEPVAPEYVYDATGRRDSFENPLKEFQAPVREPEEPLTPLQKFDLGQLRLIGVIVGKGEPTAMVIAPGGKSFILRKGVKVGKNNGTVDRITREGVQVEEKYYDFSGDVRTNIRELQLPKRGGV